MIDLDALDTLYTAATPGEWRWQGEDYRGGWGWQMLVDAEGRGLLVGQELGTKRAPSRWLRAHTPVEARLCVTGLRAAEVEGRVESVHVLQPVAAEIVALHNQYPALARELRAGRALRVVAGERLRAQQPAPTMNDTLPPSWRALREAIAAYDTATETPGCGTKREG